MFDNEKWRVVAALMEEAEACEAGFDMAFKLGQCKEIPSPKPWETMRKAADMLTGDLMLSPAEAEYIDKELAYIERVERLAVVLSGFALGWSINVLMGY